jgi:CBS-domain-containing membrane protein
MYITGPFHPPAGINPLLVVSNNLSWSFLFVPLLAGSLLLTAFAYVWPAGSAAGRGRSAGGSRCRAKPESTVTTAGARYCIC